MYPRVQFAPIEAMIWVNEIESAKSVADLKISYSNNGDKLQTNFQALDSKIASGLKKIINGDLKRRVFIQEEAAQKKRFLTGRLVTQMIYEYFKDSDMDEAVCDVDEILEVELKNDNVPSSNTRWDETIIATKKQPDEEILETI